MRLILLFVAIAVLVIVPFLIWGGTFELMFSQQAAVDWLRDLGPLAAIVAVVLLIVDIILPIPATSVMAALGIVFGPAIGGIIGSVGAFLSGTLAYVICRYLGQRGALKLLGERDYVRGERLFAQVGVWFVMLSRWMPVFPEVMACMAGLVRMHARLFYPALACGCVPMAFTFAYAGYLGADNPLVTMVVCAFAPIFMWIVLRVFINPVKL